ncbi:unnamed protein product [Lepidochelys kempii]
MFLALSCHGPSKSGFIDVIGASTLFYLAVHVWEEGETSRIQVLALGFCRALAPGWIRQWKSGGAEAVQRGRLGYKAWLPASAPKLAKRSRPAGGREESRGAAAEALRPGTPQICRCRNFFHISAVSRFPFPSLKKKNPSPQALSRSPSRPGEPRSAPGHGPARFGGARRPRASAWPSRAPALEGVPLLQQRAAPARRVGAVIYHLYLLYCIFGCIFHDGTTHRISAGAVSFLCILL